MGVNRFQAPGAQDDPGKTFGALGRVLDTIAPLAAYSAETAANVTVSAGTFRRLAPRAGGMNVTLPAADGSNTGLTITLFVESSAGTCRVRAASGTINGAAAFTLAAGSVSLIRLFSNGAGQWATERAASLPDAGTGLVYDGTALGLAPISADTVLGNVGAADAEPVEVDLSSLAGTGLGFASHQFNWDGLDFLDNGGTLLGTSTRFIQASDSTSILENWSVVGGVAFCQYQRAALTGDVTASANSNATTIAANAVTNAKAAQMARDTFRGNIGTVTANASDVPLASIDSTSIVYDATTHTFQRAALTGPYEADQNSNALQRSASVCVVSDDFFGASSGSATGAAFINTYEGQWNLAAVIGTAKWTATGSSGHPGEILFETSAVSGDRGQLELTAVDTLHAHDIGFIEANFRTSTGAAQAEYFFGWQSNSTANHHAYFHSNLGTQTFDTDNGSGTPQTTSGPFVTLTSNNTFRIEYNGTSMLLYANGTLVATHSTKVPNAVGTCFFYFQTHTGAVRSMTIDYFGLQSVTLSR